MSKKSGPPLRNPTEPPSVTREPTTEEIFALAITCAQLINGQWNLNTPALGQRARAVAKTLLGGADD